MTRSLRIAAFASLSIFFAHTVRCQHPTVAAPPVALTSSAIPGCLTDAMRDRQPPAFRERTAHLDEVVRAWVLSHPGEQRDALTIPVAVHIIHDNGDENIPDAQVIQGIQDLNDAFSNSGPYHQADGVDVGIHFCLAQQDPFGSATSGITRVLSPYTNMTSETDDQLVKDLVRWDPLRYLNIWLVREITSQASGPGVAGYAYFPSAHGTPMDGIVNEARWFGSSTDNSKVHIHEVGHYLGLYHTFEGDCANNDCLADGDHVCDTPPDGTSGPAPCGTPVNTCTTDADDVSTNNPFRPVALGGTGDQPDLFADYMDYGYQACQRLFTAGQSERMNAVLVTARASLLASAGCMAPCPGMLVAGFTSPDDAIAGTSYTFPNTSTATVPVNYSWSVDDVDVSAANDLAWTFTAVGDHTVTLRVTNPAEGCSTTATATVHVRCGVTAAFAMQPPTPAVGEAVTLTSTGQGNTLQWVVDDAPVGSGPSFLTTFNVAGGHGVRLIAQGTGCADTSATAFLPVGPCVSGANNVLMVTGGSMVVVNGEEPEVLGATPVFLAGGEGLSSICDANGHLLLYTDGQSVFNGAHQLIGSGLLGGGSSAQAGLIVPKPGSSSVYYIFTTDDWLSSGGGWMAYSEVDLSLNGGAGDMVTTNLLLMGNTSEQLAAVRSCNGEDIWVVGLERTTDTFHAFRVTTAGVDVNAVTSSPGFSHGQSLGCMKGSPKGNKLAAAFRQGAPNNVVLFDFNNALGVVTNPVALGPTPLQGQYGIEFSADGSKLYASNADDVNGTQNTITQYDLTSGVPAIMQASRTVIGTSHSPWAAGSLQRMRNGRIYVSMGLAAALGEIRHPDAVGAACDYVDFAVALPRTNYGFGLSNMVPSLEDLAVPLLIGPRELCPHNGPTTYSLSCTGNAISVEHHGPSALLGVGGTGLVLDVQEPGVDTLIIHFDNPCVTDNRDTVLIHVGAPAIDLGPDTMICSTGHLLLDAGSDGVQWSWQNNIGQQVGFERHLDVTAPGTYTATVLGVGGCLSTDAIAVSTFPSTFQSDLGPDVHPCPGPPVPLTLHAPPIGALAYQWINGSSVDSMTITTLWPMAWLTITAPNGCRDTDTLLISPVDTSSFVIDLGPDAAICPGQVWPLDAGTCDGCFYLWQDGTTQHSFTAFGPGTYSVSVISACGAHANDAVQLTASTGPVIDLGPDQVICPFSPTTLDAGITGGTLLWEDGTTGQTHVADVPGLYWVTAVTADGCTATDSLEISTCTSVGTMDATAPFSACPSPANDRLHIAVNGGMARAVELLDAVGRLVRTLPLPASTGQRSMDVDVSGVAAGLYHLHLVGAEERTVLRVMVAH